MVGIHNFRNLTLNIARYVDCIGNNIQQNSPIYKPVSICKLQACQLWSLSVSTKHMYIISASTTHHVTYFYPYRSRAAATCNPRFLPLPLLYPPETIIGVSLFFFDESQYSSTVPLSVGVTLSLLDHCYHVCTLKLSANYFLFQP